MNHVAKYFLVLVLSCTVEQTYSIQLGQYDGGEYCVRTQGSMGCHAAVSQDVFDAHDVQVTEEIRNSQEPVAQDGPMDFQALRAMFPIFQVSVNDHPLVYFDSASTAQMPNMVLDAMVEYYQSYKSNVGRGLYNFAERATYAFEQTRAKVAAFIGAQKQEIVFTQGATAAINLVAHIWGMHHIDQGDEIIVSETEHNANFIVWQQLALQKNAILKIVPVSKQGVMDFANFQSLLSDKTKLVAINHQSNILGTSNDIASIVQAAHSVGAKVLVDAAQSIAHQKIDIQHVQCDFLVFSGHKLFGPTGIGVLFIKQDMCCQCQLHNFGGGMVVSVTPEHTEFKTFPYCLEPGTQPIAQVIGLGAAIDFVRTYINFEQAQAYETSLVRQLITGLREIPSVHIISPEPQEGEHNNMVTFTVDGYHTHDVASFLDLYGIAARSGFHCVQPYHDKLGGNASLRISFSVYNTAQEVDWLISCLKKLLLN